MARSDIEFIEEKYGFRSLFEDEIEDKIRLYYETKDKKYIGENELIHIDKRRSHILDWYQFRKDSEILELGAAFGEVTYGLIDRVKSITCVEAKENRTEIIKMKNRLNENVKVICDNPITYIDLEKKYDYIIVHDAWGFVKKYYKDSKNAYNLFLQNIKKMLKNNGHFILVMDNRWGIKYFNGCIDELSKKLFVGINKYKNYNYIYGFNKKEIRKLLEQNDFCKMKFYYLNSDYYFLDRIYTDYSLNKMKYYESKRLSTYAHFSFFDLDVVCGDLQDDNIMDKFVDGFIIDCGPEDLNENILYVRDVSEQNKNNIITIYSEKDKFVCVQKLGDKQIKKNIDLDMVEKINSKEYGYDEMLEQIYNSKFGFSGIDESDIITNGFSFDNKKDKSNRIKKLIDERKNIKRVLENIHEIE